MSYIFPIELDKPSDDLCAFPWQYVLALSILGLMRRLDNRSTVQMPASCQTRHLWLGTTFHTVSPLGIMSVGLGDVCNVNSYPFGSFSANCCRSYNHLEPPDNVK